MAEPNHLELAPAINAGQVAGIIIILVLMIIGAYFLTKYVGHRAMTRGMRPSDAKKHRFFQAGSGAGGKEHTHMVNVVDRISVDPDKTLMVVEFENKYYLIGTTPNGFTRIGQVSMTREEATRAQEEAARRAERQQDAATVAAQPVQEDGAARADDGIAQSSLSDNTTTGRNENGGEAKTHEPPRKSVPDAAQSRDMASEAGFEKKRSKKQRLPDMPAGSADETFGDRFKRAFGIVLQSYLPSKMRNTSGGRSFDDELRARMRQDDDDN